MKRTCIILYIAAMLTAVSCGGGGNKAEVASGEISHADALLDSAEEALDSGDFANAQKLGEKALAIYIEKNDTANIRDCYSHLCVCNARTSNTERALTMGFKALQIDSLNKDYEAMGSDFNNVAGVYLAIQDVENARKFIDRSLEADRISGTNPSESAHLGIACEVYNKLGEHEKALGFAAKAYDIDREAGDSLKMARRISQMGDVYASMGDYGKAEANYKTSNAMMAMTPGDISKCINYKQLGSLYIKMGRPGDARMALLKSLRMAEEKGVKYLMQLNCERLAELDKEMRPADALEYLQKAYALKDSIHDEHTNRLKENYAAMYELAQKQDTINKQDTELTERLAMLWGGGVVVVLLLLACGVLFYISRLRASQQKELNRFNKTRQNFFKNITHEFMTPLTVIRGQASMMRKDESDDNKTRGYDAIVEQTDAMLKLVNQLIDLSKVYRNDESDVWRSGDAVALTRMVVENLRTHAERKLITLEFESKQQHIEMDFVPGIMRKIFSNLIYNSIKLTPRGGRIIITMRRENGWIVTNIADTGAGIPPEKLQHIFEPDNSAGIAGDDDSGAMKLVMTQQMVLSMNGTIEVKSIVGKGTLFTFSIPLRHSDRELPRWIPAMLAPGMADTKQEKREEPGRPDGKLIDSVEDGDKPLALIAEDNAEVARYMRELLLEKHRVMYAPNGRDALAKAMEYVPDIILTDLMMPEMDGYELCRNVRSCALLNHVPIIIVSAHGEHRELIKGFEAGADAYVTKPFNSEELLMRVEKLIELRKLLREKFSNALLDDTVEKVDTTAADQKFMSQLHQILQANMSDTALGSAFVAEKMFMSQRQLNRKVKALTNIDTATYIREFRILFAKQMLKNTDSSITDIYMQCGFDSPSYFSKVFKQSTGMTPTEYRKKNAQ